MASDHPVVRPSFSDKLWSLMVIIPTSFAMAWGFYYEQNQATSPVFKPMTQFVPFECWAFSWIFVGLMGVCTISVRHFNCFRTALIAGWALSTGLFISVCWAKWIDDAQVTMVGVSWTYFLWVTFGYATFRAGMPIRMTKREIN